MNPLMQATANPLAEEQRLARNQSRSSGGNSIAKGDPTADPTDVKVTDPEKATTKESHLAEEDEEDVRLSREGEYIPIYARHIINFFGRKT